jgi:hypothetical protein
MAENSRDTRGDLVDERGIVLTTEGRERARRQLVELDAYWTLERRTGAHEAFLARLGVE